MRSEGKDGEKSKVRNYGECIRKGWRGWKGVKGKDGVECKEGWRGLKGKKWWKCIRKG